MLTVQAEYETSKGKISFSVAHAESMDCLPKERLQQEARDLLNLARKTLGVPTLEEEAAAQVIRGLSAKWEEVHYLQKSGAMTVGIPDQAVYLAAQISEKAIDLLAKEATEEAKEARKLLGVLAPGLWGPQKVDAAEVQVVDRVDRLWRSDPVAAKHQEGSLEVIRARLLIGEPCLKKDAYAC